MSQDMAESTDLEPSPSRQGITKDYKHTEPIEMHE